MPNIFFRLHCPNCGKNISDEDILCPHCGVNLDAPLDDRELQALARPYLEKAKRSVESGGDLNGALADCKRALEYTPDSAEAHNLRGLVLDSMGKTADSILAYQEALRLDPDFTDAKDNLRDAEAEYKDNQWQNAGETSNQQKVELTKGKAIALGLLTVWPLVYALIFISFLMMSAAVGSTGLTDPSVVSCFIVPLQLGTILATIAVFVYYVYHLSHTGAVAANKKALWAVVLFMGGNLAMLIYWYLYIWRPLKSDSIA